MQRTAVLHALFSLLLLLVGCVGVTPLPKKTKTPAGPELKTIDISFLKPGTTKRDEVKKNLAPVDTGYDCDRFFVGDGRTRIPVAGSCWRRTTAPTVMRPASGRREI